MSEQRPSPEQPRTPRHRATAEPSGLGGVLQQDSFSVREAIGGPRGVLESAAPTFVFIVLFMLTRSVTWAGIAAVAIVLVALVVRVVQRQSPSTAIGGLIGVVIGAVWAIRSGDGSDFYAPGLVINAISLAVLLISLALRSPLVALFVAALDPLSADWRQDEDSRRTYVRATLVFAGLYAAKLLVEGPLYLAGQVDALGVAKLLMGLPLFALCAWIVWMMHRALIVRRTARGDLSDPAPDPRC